MFPGQGSQYMGMGKSLLQEFPYTSQVFEEAEDSVNVALRQLCFDGPEEELKKTAVAQPCILTASVAAWRVLQEEAGFTPDYFAGHSLGEYSALVASGKMRFSDAVKTVKLRGEAMQKAVPLGKGSMAAVMRISGQVLEEKVAECSKEGSVVEIANYNSDQQTVVAGHTDAVERLIEALKPLKARAVLLPVSAPFHSSLMRQAKVDMEPILRGLELLSNQSLVVPNTSAVAVSDYAADLLIHQIDSPVRWVQTMGYLDEHGVERCVEVGPSQVLGGLCKRISFKQPKEVLSSENLADCIAAISKA
jgi:[acyl-carrier-protein] S-malonyltransferase